MKKLLLIAFLFTSFLCEAQVNIPILEYQKCFGGSGNERIKSSSKTHTGGLIIAGTTESTDGDVTCNGNNKYWISKLDNSLNSLWQVCLGGSNAETPRSIIETSDFGFLVGGDSSSDDFPSQYGNSDAWIVKLDSLGNVQWQKKLGGTKDESASAVLEVKDEGYLILCTTESSDGDLTSTRTTRDAWLVKIDSNGNILWQKTYDKPGTNEFGGITGTLDNGYLLSGAADSLIGSNGQHDAWVVKVDHNGNIQWEKGFGTMFTDFTYDAIQLEDSTYMVLGLENLGDVWVIKMSKTGEIIWQKSYGGTGYDAPAKIKEAKDNTFYITASTSSLDGDVQGIHYGDNGISGSAYDSWLIQINGNGDLIYQKCFGGTDDDAPNGFEMINDTTFILIGSASSTDGDLAGIHYPSNNADDDIWIMKFKIISANSITGKIFQSQNTNCIQEPNEKGIPNILLKTEPKNFFGISDTSGKYTILTDTGIYKVKQITPAILKPFLDGGLVCPSIGYHTVTFSQYGQVTTEINFANYEKQCAFLQVELAQARMRRCFDNDVVIKYCNIGNVDTNNVQVIVQLPEYVSFVSASNPNYIISGKKITFNIGNLRANECGTINLVTHVDCVNNILGLTQCISAYILPRNKCVDQLQPDYALWDRSEITVEGKCTGNTARFVIKNIGQNMSDSSSYRIFKDAVQATSRRFKLSAGDSLVINITAQGNTYRLEADQTAHYPTLSSPNATIENCGTGIASRGFVNQMPQDMSAPDIEKVCLPIRDSYDPNDKQVSPSGVGTGKLVKHKVPLNFLIRFQNTGTDTAYKVVVTDTLNANLDLATLEFGASSHPYKIEFTGSGNPILKFTFDIINLVDSFTNEPKSHGFLSFKITPYDSIPNGTLVKNSADIYFDFNLPIKTNTTQVSIDDRLPTGATLSIITAVKEQKNNYEAIYVYPNPFNNATNFEFVYNTKATQLILYNINGELVAKENIENKTTYQFYRKNLSNGMYFYTIENNEGAVIGRGKLIMQ